MRELLVVILIGAAGYLAYDDYYKQRPALQQAQAEIQQLRQNPVRLNVATPGAPRAWTPVAPTPLAATRIVCPLCHGEKVVVYDPSGSGNPLSRETQTCPVCLGVGYRVLTIPPGQKICPDCQGMGLVYLRASNGPVTARNCARCGATGLVEAVK